MTDDKKGPADLFRAAEEALKAPFPPSPDDASRIQEADELLHLELLGPQEPPEPPPTPRSLLERIKGGRLYFETLERLCPDEFNFEVLPIEVLLLSVRSYNCLKKEQADTIGMLVENTEDDLLAIRNFGKVCLREVIGLLDEIGLKLRPEPPRDAEVERDKGYRQLADVVRHDIPD